MKRVALIALALLAVGAYSGITASASMAATCVKVDEGNTGNWTNAACSEVVTGQQKNYIKIQRYTSEYQPAQWCAEIEPGEVTQFPLRFTNGQCTTLIEFGHFEKIIQRPGWYVNKAQLKQGAKQLKLQLKGQAVLTSKVLETPLTIKCNTSVSEGSSIEGNGLGQGQDKGRLTFTSCSVTSKEPSCVVEEPITTVQTKSRLVTFEGKQTKYADLFEPQQGTTYANVVLVKGGGICSIAGTFPVKGSIAAEILPQEKEGQEGILNFPASPIETVLTEQGPLEKIGLFLGANPAKFAATYGARLATNEPYGVFGSF